VLLHAGFSRSMFFSLDVFFAQGFSRSRSFLCCYFETAFQPGIDRADSQINVRTGRLSNCCTQSSLLLVRGFEVDAVAGALPDRHEDVQTVNEVS
jgi:hypothetical protein